MTISHSHGSGVSGSRSRLVRAGRFAVHTSARRRWRRTLVGIVAIGLPTALATVPPSPASAAPGVGARVTDRFTADHAAIGPSTEHPVVLDSPRSHLRPMLAGVTVEPYGKCNSAGVFVLNESGSDIEVRLYLDGAPAFIDNSWYAVADLEGRLLSGEAPAPGSTYELVQRGPADTEIPLGTVTYTPPDYCDDFVVTFTDTCATVTVTVASSHGADALFTIAQTDGPTYPVVQGFAVPAGQTASVDVAITAEISELGLYFDAETDYLARYRPEGPENCGAPDAECGNATPPDTAPPETTSPPTEPSTTTSTVADTTTSTVGDTTTSTVFEDTTTTSTTSTVPFTEETRPTVESTTTTSTVPVVIAGIPPGLLTTTTQPVPRVRGAAGESRGFAPEVAAAVPCPDTPDDPGTPTDPGTPGDPGSPGGTLPVTGASTTTVGALAGLLVLVGGAALTLTRRR